MNIQEFANKLNGNQYRNEITKELVEEAGQNGFVVMFGYSDDNIELRGAIYEEVGAWKGTDILFHKGNVLELEDPFEELEDQILFLERYGLKLGNKKVTAVWNEENDFVWTFKTDIPHATFDIFEDEEPFCKGIVFDVSLVA